MAAARSERARYRRIVRFAARQFVIQWWYEMLLPKIGLARVAERTRARRMARFARGFRDMAVGLGGLMIKVGQFLSSRLDVMPKELTEGLQGLQDEVPAEEQAAVRAMAETELGMPLERAYARFDPEPVAAASLGQAHRAVLPPHLAAEAGFSDVVVKIQRPGIDRIVEVDLRALRRVAGWLSRVRIVADRVDAPALVDEFAGICRDEIDYLHEAANCERFAASFADDDRVRTPGIAWERSGRRVLTLEDVSAVKITDIDSLRAAGIDPAEVAPVFAEVMLEQVFSSDFFHADPHPGNVFVEPGEGGAWRLAFVDFGMMGEVPERMRRGLRALVIAMAARDGGGLVAAVRDVGVLLPSADTRELERALTALFDRFGGMGFAELRDVDPREFRDFGDEFRDVVRTLPIQLPENFLLIVRAASLTSGVSTALDPKFNIWDSLEPYAARLVADESAGLAGDFAKGALENARVAWRLPKRIDGLLDRFDDGSVAVSSPAVERRMARLEAALRRTISAVLFAALMVSGAVVYGAVEGVGVTLMAVSALPLLHVLFARRR
ncbi:ABC1 kinase family protein [Microbacterium halophytorum]|uniref:ABC1 kinase family protein n=1 Tax=Microbacterium halophytorum TaxID=2067568 RepID=UPI000CFD951E|nr:AarF/UbiB family protein [Microbacterium halophytorum]